MSGTEPPHDEPAANPVDIGTVGPSDGHRRNPASPDSPTIPRWPSMASMLNSRDRRPDQLAPGQVFGSYEIVRLLGAGGMGQVYEAIQKETGHRLALKLLMSRLSSDEDSKRFLREGRVAASINHPHTVYIYGAEVIEGNPVITMEMVRGDTLYGLSEKRGPLPVDETIEFALDIISGLKAAAAEGILHRDIKPANCFLDENGRVKIGDFGLSISIRAGLDSSLTAMGTLLGTPAFASPEQLRGASLDIRSDIYSLGATLYYLLTGDTPFHADNLAEYIAKVLESPAPPFRRARVKPESPHVAPSRPHRITHFGRAHREVESIVQKCLKKNPNDRPQSYDDLEESLRALRRTSLQCPPPGRRILASLIDLSVLVIVFFVLMYIVNVAQRPWELAFLFMAIAFLYLLVPEVLFKGSLGKLICGLRIVRVYPLSGWLDTLLSPLKFICGLRMFRVDSLLGRLDILLMRYPALDWFLGYPLGGGPLWSAILSRWGYHFLAIVLALVGSSYFLQVLTKFIPVSPLLPLFAIVLLVGAQLLPFATARRRNCYAGLHELMSATRVVSRLHRTPLIATTTSVRSDPNLAGRTRVGPYTIVDCELPIPDVQSAYDPLLKRSVWIRWLGEETRQATEARRDIARPGRLRWLNAGSYEGRSWKAYSSVDGAPLLFVSRAPQPWSRVRQWLLELAAEFESASQDDTLPEAVTLNHVWIQSNGRAMLLDFPSDAPRDQSASRSGEALVDATWTSIQGFLHRVAYAALDLRDEQSARTTHPRKESTLPMHARRILERLSAHEFSSPAVLTDELRAHADSPDQLIFSRRVQRLLVYSCIPVTIAAYTFLTVALPERSVLRAIPEAFRFWLCMNAWRNLDREAANGAMSPETKKFVFPVTRRGLQVLRMEGNAQELKDAFEVFIAVEFSPLVLDPKIRNNRFVSSVYGSWLAAAEKIVVRVGKPSDERVRWARTVVEPIIAGIHEERNGMAYFLWNIPTSLLPIAFVDILSQFVYVGGVFLYAFGGTLVGRAGREVSRFRAAARAVVVWSPVVVVFWCMTILPTTQSFKQNIAILGPLTQVWAPEALAVLYAVGALWILTGRRGLHDILSGVRVIAR